MSAERQPITADDAPAAVGPYSHAVRSGGFLFLSGQTPLDPSTGQLVEGDIGEQTRQCLRNLQAVAGLPLMVPPCISKEAPTTDTPPPSSFDVLWLISPSYMINSPSPLTTTPPPP